VSLALIVRSMNFDLKVPAQVFSFSMTSKQKSIDIAPAANQAASFKRPYRNCPDHTDARIPSFLLRGSPDRNLSFLANFQLVD
jgi:hypothetical protein